MSFHLVASRQHVCPLAAHNNLFIPQTPEESFSTAPPPPQSDISSEVPFSARPFNHLSAPSPGLSGPSPVGEQLALALPTLRSLCAQEGWFSPTQLRGLGFQPATNFLSLTNGLRKRGQNSPP